MRFGVLLDDVAEVFECYAWFSLGYGKIETLSRGLDQADDVWIAPGFLAYVICLVEICMVAFEPQRDIKVDNIAIFERPLVGYAMADDFVDRCAYRFWEVVVIEW